MDASDAFDQIRKLLEARDAGENGVARRSNQINYLWGAIAFLFTTGIFWVIWAVLWYAKVEQTIKTVYRIHNKIYGYPPE